MKWNKMKICYLPIKIMNKIIIIIDNYKKININKKFKNWKMLIKKIRL